MVAIFVAFMFVSLVLTDLAVEKWQAWRVAHRAQARSMRAEVMAPGLDAWCQVPEGVQLAEQHTWVKPYPMGKWGVGADALVARAVGAVRRIVLPKVGDQVSTGQPLCRLEHNGRAITIPSSLTGWVTAVNDRLVDQPELLSSDPYGSGWICYLDAKDAQKPDHSLRIGEQAARWLENEFVRFREFIFAQAAPDLALGITSQDGGIPAVGCLSELDAAAWSAFEVDFLKRP